MVLTETEKKYDKFSVIKTRSGIFVSIAFRRIYFFFLSCFPTERNGSSVVMQQALELIFSIFSFFSPVLDG